MSEYIYLDLYYVSAWKKSNFCKFVRGWCYLSVQIISVWWTRFGVTEFFLVPLWLYRGLWIFITYISHFCEIVLVDFWQKKLIKTEKAILFLKKMNAACSAIRKYLRPFAKKKSPLPFHSQNNWSKKVDKLVAFLRKCNYFPLQSWASKLTFWSMCTFTETKLSQVFRQTACASLSEHSHLSFYYFRNTWLFVENLRLHCFKEKKSPKRATNDVNKLNWCDSGERQRRKKWRFL